MESERYAVKLFAEDGATATTDDLTRMFHAFIQEETLRETCVDVADYTHVPSGPGVMLICHEAHYGLDQTGGRLGLKCSAKRGGSGDRTARLLRVLDKATAAALAIENHPQTRGKIRFRTNELWVGIEDRLAAPPTPETWEIAKPMIVEALRAVWAAPAEVRREQDPKAFFQVTISLPEKPLSEIASALAAVLRPAALTA